MKQDGKIVSLMPGTGFGPAICHVIWVLIKDDTV